MNRDGVRLLLAGLVSLGAASAANADIQEIGIAGDGEHTRITLAGDQAVDHDIVFGNVNGQRTIELMLPRDTVTPDAYTGRATGGISQYDILEDRIVFHLDRSMLVSREIPLPPAGSEARHRLILDLTTVSDARFDYASRGDEHRLASYQPQPERAAQAVPVEQPTLTLANLNVVGPVIEAPRPETGDGRYTIVIDPGHGGHDPGALGSGGAREETIVLETSLALKAELERNPRYDVRMTRDTDKYVEHEDRVTLARNWGANLFISIHADAAASSSVAGASVYTLSSRGELRQDGEAKINNWQMPIEDGTPLAISGILEDLIKRETKSNSTIFAEMATPELAKAGPVVRNSHRQANLAVLLAPDVPAVLVEIGFVTNSSDAARLKSSTGQAKTAEALRRAIDRYFDRQDMVYATN